MSPWGNKKDRDCPAIGGVISSEECREGRISRYACTDDCPFNPWTPANYERAQQIDKALTSKILKRLRSELPEEVNFAQIAKEEGKFAAQCVYVRKLFMERDRQGHSFVDRWRERRFEGLTNDQRVLLESQVRSRLGLLEIHRVLEGDVCEAVDMLTPEAGTLRIHDISTAEQAVRFDQFLVWYYQMPCYVSLYGSGLTVPDVTGFDGPDVLRSIVKHLNGPTENEAMRAWVAEHPEQITQAFFAVNRATYAELLKSLDIRVTITTYRMKKDRSHLLERLDDLAWVETRKPSDAEQARGFRDCRICLGDEVLSEHGDSAVPDQTVVKPTRPILGKILIGADRVCLETQLPDQNRLLRKRFEKVAGRLVRFEGEGVLDLAEQIRREKMPTYDESLVPPELLRYAPRLQLDVSRIDPKAFPEGITKTELESIQRARQTARFADEPNLALDGRTPREAANDPLLRPRLITLMKKFVRLSDRRPPSDTPGLDVDQLLKDLGLNEIMFERPARFTATRPLPPDGVPEDKPRLAEMLLFPPPLPPGPLNEKDAVARLSDVLKAFPDPYSMVSQFKDTAPEVMSFLDGFSDSFSESEMARMVIATALLWFCFFPPECRSVSVNLTRLVARYEEILRTLSDGDVQELTEILENGRQPVLVSVVLMFVLTTDSEASNSQDSAKAKLFLGLLLVALADELDQLVREMSREAP